MPTIGQLPLLGAVDPEDELPISHAGTTQSTSIGTLLSGTQPAILTPTGTLLGRESLGIGGPEPISVGGGLRLLSGVLAATGTDHSSFPSQNVLQPCDQAVLSSSGTPMLLELSLLRGLFSAGSNIAISSTGTISAAVSAPPTGSNSGAYSIANLPIVPTIAANDLVGISQGGIADSITYQNFLSGLTINEAQAAAAASDSDTAWVAQGSDTMVCQTFSAIWAWIVSKQPSYKTPVMEITTNTTLDGTVHNGKILVCSQPVILTPVFTNMGSGFACSIINLSGANVTFGAGIVSSLGTAVLPAGLACTIQGVIYSGGSIIYASVSGTTSQSAQNLPGSVTALAVTGVSSTGVSLAWAAPSSGGAVTGYTIQYQISGATAWTTATSLAVGTAYSVSGLQPSSSYCFLVSAVNAIGSGPQSGIVTGATTAAAGIIPGQVIGLAASMPSGTSVTLTWSPPSVGTAPISYTVNYRATGTTAWVAYAAGVSTTSIDVMGLSGSTSYDFEVIASNAAGAGIASAVISCVTTAIGGSVTTVIWNTTPSGSYTHANGSIAVNAHITPPTATVQFGFSTSSTVPPVSWTLANFVNTDLWGAYVSIPTAPGAWYAWVEGIDGSLPTVYATPFTVT